jgi:transposase
VTERLGQELVPDELWGIVEPLLLTQPKRPQGGGTRYVEDRAVFTAIVYVLTTGCAWRHLPAEFGVSKATAHRRFMAWTEAGLWRKLHRAVLDRLGEQAAVAGGRPVEVEDGRRAFEKMLTYANHVGLYSEEITLTGEQIGNLPQAFTHLAFIDAATSLDAAQQTPDDAGPLQSQLCRA